jgi:hypothetical protein
MAWDPENAAVNIQRDEAGHVRLIRHFQYPFEYPTTDPRTIVVAYLRAVKDLLELLDAATIDELDETASTHLPKKRIQLQWGLQFSIRGETDVVTIQQILTVSGSEKRSRSIVVPVQFAGLRVLVHRLKGELRIIGIASTINHDRIEVSGLVRGSTNPRADNVQDVLRSFGLPPIANELVSRVEKPIAIIHRFQPGSELGSNVKPPLVAGAYYLAKYVRVVPGTSQDSFPPYDLVYRAGDLAPLQAEALVTHADGTATDVGVGLVFEIDPASASGDLGIRPKASPAVLDDYRAMVPLRRLSVPGTGDAWALSGTNVHIYDGSDPSRETPKSWGWIGVKPPTTHGEPTFAYRSRTNDFAAVNAYYDLDRMFTLLEAFELPFSTFPIKYRLPAPVIHRAALHPGPCNDGKCVNAQVQIVLSHANPLQPYRTVLFAFALADLSRNPGSPEHPVEPLGIACDVRIVWHEFCHALIAAATDFLELPFAHSAGDALAAINGDPVSQLAGGAAGDEYRGLTYPWGTSPNRRHDRPVSEGWSWSSAIGQQGGYEGDIRDMFGYAREQLLSTTLFRLYCAIGGDATDDDGEPDRVTRQAAALYSTYLIARAICSLGPRRTVPARDAEAFAMALAEADIGTTRPTPPLDRIGGTLHKVIRWAFEKQGLFQTDGHRADDGSGQPEPIDVFLEDGRNGEYPYTAEWQATADAIWNSTMPDPKYGDQTPVLGQDNFIFVKLRNRGHQPARNATVCVFSALEGQDAIWDRANWKQLKLPGEYQQTQNQDSPADELVFGPFVWHPTCPSEYSFLAHIDADGDYANVNPATKLPCAAYPIPVAAVVPFDNNIGLRTIRVPSARTHSGRPASIR